MTKSKFIEYAGEVQDYCLMLAGSRLAVRFLSYCAEPLLKV